MNRLLLFILIFISCGITEPDSLEFMTYGGGITAFKND
jgi:hypothetical protein